AADGASAVLLKHLRTFPEHTQSFWFGSDRGSAALVLLDARVSDYDRTTYPKAAHIVLINSDEPTLTRKLLTYAPHRGGGVFKLSSDEDRDIISEKYSLRRSTRYLSFTAATAFPIDDQVAVGQTTSDATFAMFRKQGHARNWLQALLNADRAFNLCTPGAGGA